MIYLYNPAGVYRAVNISHLWAKATSICHTTYMVKSSATAPAQLLGSFYNLVS